MAKAKQTPVAAATGATPFPTAEQLHATTQAVLNAPPKGINWDGFDADLTNAFAVVAKAEETMRALAGKMYQCGVRFAQFNNEKGEMDDKAPVCVELRKRLAKRLTEREQVLLKMDQWNAAALSLAESDLRRACRTRINKMVSLIRKHIKTVEDIKTGRSVKTLEQRLYAMCTEIRQEIINADPDKAKFDILATRELIEELREHFNI